MIRSLSIERFRGVSTLTWLPATGVNVILGGSDVGKTTILEAIALLLSPTNSGTIADTDYHRRDVAAEFAIEAVMTLPAANIRDHSADRATLAALAHKVMLEGGLEPDFPLAAQLEQAAIDKPAEVTGDVRDLRNLLWSSIDNDDSRDLDQLTVAEQLAGGQVRILVAVADVDALVHKGLALDAHASCNTTIVYTPAAIFPMLPEGLSTDLTSLNEDQDRIAMVTDMVFEADGMGELGVDQADQMAQRTEGARFLFHAGLPRQPRNQIRRNQIANLPQYSKLTAPWNGCFHPCPVAGQPAFSKPFSLPAMSGRGERTLKIKTLLLVPAGKIVGQDTHE